MVHVIIDTFKKKARFGIMNKKLIDNIGLDMDGVLIDLEQYQYLKGIPYFCKKFKKNPEDIIVDSFAYDVEDIFQCTKNERMIFWLKYIWPYCLTMPAREGASEITHKWHNEGRKVDIITSRVYVMQDNLLGALFRKMVYIWLKKNKIYFDRIKFCSEEKSYIDKVEACKEFETKLMVDDKINNLKELKKILIAVCFDAGWNRVLEDCFIKRLNSFYEIDEYIQEIEKKKIKMFE